MNRNLRNLSIGAAALALVGVGSVASHDVFAQSATPSAAATAEAGTTDRHDGGHDFLTAFANNLGVTDQAAIDAAIRETFIQMVDERLAAGEISQDRADAMKAEIEAGNYPGGPNFDGMGGMRGGHHDGDRDDDHGRGDDAHGGMGGDMGGGMPGQPADRAAGGGMMTSDDLAALADFLGETPAELQAEIDSGMTPREIAEAHGKTLADLKDFMQGGMQVDPTPTATA